MSLLLLKIKALDNDDHDNSIDNNNNNDKDDNSIINNISIDNDTNIHYHCCNHHHHYRKINKNTRIQRKKTQLPTNNHRPYMNVTSCTASS